MFTPDLTIAAFDPELASAMEHERQRQEDHVELIASENYASPRVLEAQGSVLTNKYAEGYPGTSATTAAASTSTSPSDLADRARARPCLLRTTPTSSPIRGPRPTPPPSWPLIAAGRHDSRHESGAWRSPDPWRQSQFLRAGSLPCGPVRDRRPRPARSTTTRSGALARRASTRNASSSRVFRPTPGSSTGQQFPGHRGPQSAPTSSPTWRTSPASLQPASIPAPIPRSPMSSPPPPTRPCAARSGGHDPGPRERRAHEEAEFAGFSRVPRADR